MIEMAEFTIDRAPPSNNDDVFKTTAGKMRVAKEWRDLINAELEKLDLPRPIPMVGPLHVFVTVRFRVERGQETTNYYDFVMKRLGDCLRGGHPNYYGLEGEEHAAERARICAEHPVGWIVDDKDHHWQPRFAINRAKFKGKEGATTVRLLWESAVSDAFESSTPVLEEVPSVPDRDSEFVPDFTPGPEERKLRNRRYFARHGVWPAVVFQERMQRMAGVEVDDDFAQDISGLGGLISDEVKRELGR